ncbi:MAG: hypothetical protein DHS20C18_34320 [Saprospiraceae bacterium]|nr:MAG: hypothetical protein DHS20C18_34320 [Saprospiraceae bacterium]
MKKWIIFFAGLWWSCSLWGQAQTSFHEIFPLDSVKMIQLDLYDEPEIKPWPGNNIMIETKVKLYDASEVILDHFVEGGRYKVETVMVEDQLTLLSVDKERKTIKTKHGECFEEVKTVVYMPENFTESGTYQYLRSDDN